ncbi:sigma 54-interacting transcriptional regulator [Clostridium sp. MB40-C1]|uniref:sigma-54 interaction domain-containing protein n=1 Tax=Clostridium sp. MB40-C1 TaxID=3070996 RepID=UPI0027E08BE9|nr:sigma 54-interacting transcriptional regulator [Clostridium sp. MB40-C1]WMJ80468.1 sigma 54-interacting transcriptional regulator [Clostridium sp. MB40-C1]
MEKELLKAVFNSISDGILVLDNKLHIINFNKMAVHILGLSDNILMRKYIKDIFDNYMLLEECFEKNISCKNKDCTFTIKENKIRCVTNICPITNNVGKIGMVIIFRDTRHIHKVVNNVIGYSATYTFQDIITKNSYMKKIIQYAKKAANTECNILLEGKSGTGKEVFAQAIHNHSSRAKGPFVAVNCAAIPRELFESELFGYEKGAFTGAKKGGYPGKFELAEGGTIFLDEIGELPLDIQSKLLRVLDNHKIVRVGSTYEKKINVRVISATNKKLSEEVNEKNFRYDLYYRLNVIGIHLIELKDRHEDIEILAKYFMNKLNLNNKNTVKNIENRAMKELQEYQWCGNVRELRNVIEKSYYLCDNDNITREYILTLLKDKPKMEQYFNLDINNTLFKQKEEVIPIKTLEEQSIQNALKVFNGNAEEAAKALGISRATIYRKINKYGIDIL